MKKLWIAALAVLFLFPALKAELPVWLEGAGVLGIDGGTNVAIEGNVLIDVMKRLQVRANIVTLNLTNAFRLSLSSGLGLDVLLHFPGKDKMSFYGVGGFFLGTGEGDTSLDVSAGPGIQLSKSKKMKLFLEGLVNFMSWGGESDVGFIIRGGVRIR